MPYSVPGRCLVRGKAETSDAGRAEKLERNDMDTAVSLLHNLTVDSTRSTRTKKVGDWKFLDEKTECF